MKKTIYRNCGRCDKHLRIHVAEDGTVEGGYAFQALLWDDLENVTYFECEDCYE